MNKVEKAQTPPSKIPSGSFDEFQEVPTIRPCKLVVFLEAGALGSIAIYPAIIIGVNPDNSRLADLVVFTRVGVVPISGVKLFSPGVDLQTEGEIAFRFLTDRDR